MTGRTANTEALSEPGRQEVRAVDLDCRRIALAALVAGLVLGFLSTFVVTYGLDCFEYVGGDLRNTCVNRD
jgi:hypothetical protein